MPSVLAYSSGLCEIAALEVVPPADSDVVCADQGRRTPRLILVSLLSFSFSFNALPLAFAFAVRCSSFLTFAGRFPRPLVPFLFDAVLGLYLVIECLVLFEQFFFSVFTV